MALRAPEPPDDSVTAVRAGLTSLTQAGRFTIPEQPTVAAEDLELTRPHRAYLLGLDDLQAGRALEAARPTGWRYLVLHAGAPVALAETVLDRDGNHLLAQVNYGPFAAGSARAFDAAEELEATDTEARLLHVPALHFLALWLHEDTPEAVLVPIAPTISGITANQPYPAAELLADLSERARAQVDQADDAGT
jgi:hypothetical protein